MAAVADFSFGSSLCENYLAGRYAAQTAASRLVEALSRQDKGGAHDEADHEPR